MDTFKASEIFQVSMKIEEAGEKLYRHARDLTDDKKMKDLFGFLAGEEMKHKKTFQEMVSKLESYEPPETYPGEYYAYLGAYANHIVFQPEEMEGILEELDDPEEIVEFAIQREIESILYYIEAKSLVPKAQRDEIDRIIDEERKHYLKLVEVRRCVD